MTVGAVLVLLAWGALAGGFPASGQDKPGPSSGPAVESLIRKDLLGRTRPAEVRPRRNIFIRNGGPVVEAPPAESPRAKPEVPATPGQPEATEPDIRFVGCVLTARQTVAIVIVDGQALAVAEGDRLADVFTVQEISPEALTLVDAQGQTRTISIRGEKS